MPSVEGSSTGPHRVPFPVGGVASQSTYRDQPALFCPPETTRCIRPFDIGKDRPRLGSAPGIVKLFNQTFGNGTPIQQIDTVSRASVIQGYHLGDHARIIGRSSLAAPVTGQVFGYQAAPIPGLEWMATVDVSGGGGPGTVSVVAVGHHPDTDFVAVGTAAYSDGSGHNVVTVAALDRYGAQVWATKIALAGTDLFLNTVEVTRLYTMVTVNEKVYALRNDTGTVAETTNCAQWSDECVCALLWRDTTTNLEYLYVLFNGRQTTTSATLPNGTAITSGFYAKSFRSGVMKFLIASDAYASTPVFTQVSWGRQVATTDTYYEASHGYFRISENSELKPRGAIVNDMAIDPFGNILIARCNAGGGPSAAFPPSLAAVRPVSVCMVSSSGVMLWEKDTNSIMNNPGFLTFINDIPTGAGVEPSVQAIEADGDTVYAGGAPNAAGACVIALNAANGSLKWTIGLEPSVGPPNQTIRQAAVAIDPTDGNLVLGGDNSTSWPGASGAHAHAWKLNKVDGSILWTIDLSDTVSCLGVSYFPDGRLALVTDEF